ncbi:type II toxin-antitoxin system RelE/ParE family toxin [Candidatus Calescamantes bacterium]|nr:type II toxin-antitoxin system RelE/ParE family toxin [Candidatus Calescamantes bacterium]
MEYKTIILPSAVADLEKLPKERRSKILRRIKWLSQNAEFVIHHQLRNMPPDLRGLCRLRSGAYRILYWFYPEERVIKVYQVRHRSSIYRRLS